MRNLFKIALVFVMTFVGASCSSDDDYGWYDSVPDGGAFMRANTVKFYYVDGEGKGLIDPNNTSTFPVTFGRELSNPVERTADYTGGEAGGYYNGNHQFIGYDADQKLYYCKMVAYGDMSKHTFPYPLYFGNDVDELQITYRYTDKDVDGGKYASTIISWKYNGKYIYSDDDGNDVKVYVQKSGGKTSVSVKK